MSDQTGVPVDKLAVGGPGLSFIGIYILNKITSIKFKDFNFESIVLVYPEALSLMPFPVITNLSFLKFAFIVFNFINFSGYGAFSFS